MALNIVDESTLTVSSTSIGLSSADPTLAAAEASGARQAVITVLTAPVCYHQDGGAATTADPILYPGDNLNILGDSMRNVLTNLRFIRLGSTSGALSIRWFDRDVINVPLVSRQGVSVVDAAGVSIEKAEDAAHTSGDKGIMALGVRNDTPASLGGTDGDYVPSQFDRLGNQRVVDSGVPMFGEPTLFSQGAGKASWDRAIRTSTIVTDQKSTTGWLANLDGGVQTSWDDAAALYIPLDEMPLPDLASALWSYYMNTGQTFGCQMSIWVHDPTDNDKRGDIIQLGNVAGLEKTSGWNAHELSLSTAQFFFYAEGESGNTVCTTEGAANLYTLAQFQSDPCFSTWTIYRISLNNGFENSGTFQPIHVADVKINGQVIPLGPKSGKHKKTVTATKTLVGGANAAFDVVSDSIDAGTDWDFAMAGTGKITKAVLDIGTTALTAEYSLHLFSYPPTCNLHDNVANTSPVTADVPYFLGAIEFPALRDYGTTGHSYSVATPSTPGNAPLEFHTPMIYGVLIAVDAHTPGNVTGTIHLTGDMED